jgi:hypothetical protein
MLCQDLGDSDGDEVNTVEETRTVGYEATSSIKALQPSAIHVKVRIADLINPVLFIGGLHQKKSS